MITTDISDSIKRVMMVMIMMMMYITTRTVISMHWIHSNHESDRKGGEGKPTGIFRSTDSLPINQMD